MSDEAITHGGADRGFKLCRCVKCGTEEQCTPHRDFYTLAEDGDTGPLYCESCFREHMRKLFAKKGATP